MTYITPYHAYTRQRKSRRLGHRWRDFSRRNTCPVQIYYIILLETYPNFTQTFILRFFWVSGTYTSITLIILQKLRTVWKHSIIIIIIMPAWTIMFNKTYFPQGARLWKWIIDHMIQVVLRSSVGIFTPTDSSKALTASVLICTSLTIWMFLLFGKDHHILYFVLSCVVF